MWLTQLKYWEKAQEYRLCELKLKELKRHRRHRELKPLEPHQTLPSQQSSSVRVLQTTDQFADPSRLGNWWSTQNNANEDTDNMMLTEENVKLHNRRYEDDDGFSQYSKLDKKDKSKESNDKQAKK